MGWDARQQYPYGYHHVRRRSEIMEIAARLELEDLEEFRRLETELRVLESGQGNLSWEQACAIVDAHRDCWIRMYEKYDLEDDEIHEVDTIRGIIFVGE
jgi:ribosome assembly protein YihI (activator of Der GTPase)